MTMLVLMYEVTPISQRIRSRRFVLTSYLWLFEKRL